MHWGSGWSLPYGNPESWVITLDVSDFRTGVAITFLAVFSQYYQLVVDGHNVGSPIFCAAGTTTVMRGAYTFTTAPHTVSVVGVGPWAALGKWDTTVVQSAFLAPRNDRIHLDLISTPEQFSFGDGGQLTNWSINGLKRFTNCRPVQERPTWCELDLLITTTGTTHEVDLNLKGTTVARGSRIGNGTVTLSQVGGSGIAALGTNTVTLTYTADIASGATFTSANCAAFNIYYQITNPVVSFVTKQATTTANFWDSPVLSTGLYYIVVRSVNEDGVESTNTANQSIQLYKVPASPGVPVYVSGGASSFYSLFDELGNQITDEAGNYLVGDQP